MLYQIMVKERGVERPFTEVLEPDFNHVTRVIFETETEAQAFVSTLMKNVVGTKAEPHYEYWWIPVEIKEIT